MENNQGKNVLITGASSGIGKALAAEFAKNNYNIIAVAQDPQKLASLKSEMESSYNVVVTTIEKDLAADNAAKELYQEVKEKGLAVDILVNDAGVGERGYFTDNSFGKYSEIIHLNIVALTQLTHLYLKEMIFKNDGRILQLGSIAGFQPGPLMAVYHASKAYVVSLSEALATELNDMGSDVTITCLCPGPTDTNFFSGAHAENTKVYQNKEATMQSPEEVAAGAYNALMNGERVYIPGAMNKVMTFMRRVIPKSMQANMQKQYYETAEE